ncbi:MAG: ankyrin repeat domain-containing protein [Burkholderiales bacterium]
MSVATAFALLSLAAGQAGAQTTRALGDDGLAQLDVIEEQIVRATQRKDVRKLDEAITALEMRQRKTGADAKTSILLVKAYLERSPNFYGRKAFQAAEQAIRLDPSNPEAHLARASIGIVLDCVPCAEGAIEDAEKVRAPTAGIAAAKAALELMKAAALAREPGAGGYLDGGIDARIRAGALIRQAVAAESRPIQRSSLLVWHARVAAGVDSDEANMNLLKQALEIDPENIAALRQYATILAFNKGEIERAAKLVAPLGDIGDSALWAIKAAAPYARWANAWKDAPEAPETKALLEAAKQAAPESDEVFQFVSMQRRYAYVALAMLKAGIYRIASIEYRDKDGDTALANMVLNAGEGVSATAKKRRLAAASLDVVDALLAAGANPNAWASRGREPIIAVAARYGDRALFDRLIAARADPHAIAANGTTVLLAASQSEDHEAALAIARSLLQRGARVDSHDRFQQTPLMAATQAGNVDLVHHLIGNQANVGLKDIDGQTALDWAAAGGHEGAVRMLLEAGAEINETSDARGRFTTLDRAKRSGNGSIVELLKRHQKSSS